MKEMTKTEFQEKLIEFVRDNNNSKYGIDIDINPKWIPNMM